MWPPRGVRSFAAMAYEDLKQRQSVMWGTGPYQRVTETIADIHARGADVTGIDLAPALIATAADRAAGLGHEIDYRVGDCERLDVPDGRSGRRPAAWRGCSR